jgi:hypothetical protein
VTPTTDSRLWDRLLSIIGTLPDSQRAAAVVHVLQAMRGNADMDDAAVDRLVDDIRREHFGG